MVKPVMKNAFAKFPSVLKESVQASNNHTLTNEVHPNSISNMDVTTKQSASKEEENITAAQSIVNKAEQLNGFVTIFKTDSKSIKKVAT